MVVLRAGSKLSGPIRVEVCACQCFETLQYFVRVFILLFGKRRISFPHATIRLFVCANITQRSEKILTTGFAQFDYTEIAGERWG